MCFVDKIHTVASLMRYRDGSLSIEELCRGHVLFGDWREETYACICAFLGGKCVALCSCADEKPVSVCVCGKLDHFAFFFLGYTYERYTFQKSSWKYYMRSKDLQKHVGRSLQLVTVTFNANAQTSQKHAKKTSARSTMTSGSCFGILIFRENSESYDESITACTA